MRLRLFVLFILINLCAKADQPLNSGWYFRQAGQTQWYSAQVPGTNYTDLLAHGLIPDPFFGDNEKKVQWVDTCYWEYQDTFSVVLNQGMSYRLEFEGLDTYAEVFLNGTKIISADNMFRKWSASVTNLLQKQNVLFVRFAPASSELKKRMSASPVKYPGGNRVFGRKAAYQFGWDWGPEFQTCGIWKNVVLKSEKRIEFIDVHVVQESLSSLEAKLKFECRINSKVDTRVTIKIATDDGEITSTFNTELKKGENNLSFSVVIKNPELWWPNGSGSQHLYNFSLLAGDDLDLASYRLPPIGLRTIELVREKDKAGSTFYFKVNGKPVFMKGANVIPPDHFLPRAGNEGWEKIVDDAAWQNMNMVRVWGGGVYPSDSFYEACDRKGILVWQDFMFACAMYPADSAFLENVKLEIDEQVIRIRNHPCLALYCGNNEVDEGWKNWGWQKEMKYSAGDSVFVKSAYDKLFLQLIPDELKRLDSSRSYWPSSPSIGWGHEESMKSGDSHYWGVWWGMEPFSTYTKKVPRFMSEYGFQSFPSNATLLDYTGTSDVQINAPAIRVHQKHARGFETISAYMDGGYNRTKNLKGYALASMALQCDAMQTAIYAHRKAKPYCMGTLYWQLNDTWPVVSWCSVDYYHRKKASAFLSRELYKNCILVPQLDSLKKQFNVYAVSDSLNDIPARMELKLLSFTGDLRWSEVKDFNLAANTSAEIYSKNLESILRPLDTTQTVLNVKLYSGTSMLYETNVFFCLPKNLKLVRPSFSIKKKPDVEGRPAFEVSTPYLSHFTEISYKGDPSFFSRNYFDMLPGEKYLIFIDPSSPVDGSLKGVSLQSLIDTY